MSEGTPDEELGDIFGELLELPKRVEKGIQAYRTAKELFNEGVLTSEELLKVLNHVREVLHLPPL